jgi:hypothetical protein
VISVVSWIAIIRIAKPSPESTVLRRFCRYGGRITADEVVTALQAIKCDDAQSLVKQLRSVNSSWKRNPELLETQDQLVLNALCGSLRLFADRLRQPGRNGVIEKSTSRAANCSAESTTGGRTSG